MTGTELLRRLKRLARRRGVEVVVEMRLGKGSHRTVFFGDRRTVLKDPKAEIGKGLLHKMLADLGLDEEDI